MALPSYNAPSSRLHVMVMAKSPRPGKVKTRLCPPLTHAEAASLAEASLADTLDAVAQSAAERRIIALDGPPGGWLPSGFEVIEQRGRTLDERLAAAWKDAGGPGFQIGMDTPQVSAGLLDSVLDGSGDGPSAALGLAEAGGWWGIGLWKRWDLDVFTGVPMSTEHTAAAQLERLEAAGHSVSILPVLSDVDRFTDAIAVADRAPGGRFAEEVSRLRARQEVSA